MAEGDGLFRSGDDMGKFCSVPENVRRIPAGRIREVGNPVMWISGNMERFTTEMWKKEFGTDPEELWNEVQNWIAKNHTRPGLYHR
jgi:hypothetical protein